MNDFFVIKKADRKHLIPEDTVDLFQESKRYIFETLATAGDRKTVVVTHHGVSPLSIQEQFRGDSLNCAFMTDISNEIIDHGPYLWVHGHTHNSFDYTLGKTRVVVNPYGYKDVEVNPQFDKQLVIEL
jgi:Icc-related predicted phosphoesterase